MPPAGALGAVARLLRRAHSGSQDADAFGGSSFCPLTAAAVDGADATAAPGADAAELASREVSLPEAGLTACAASGAAEISLLLAPARADVGMPAAAAISAAAVAGGPGAIRLQESRSDVARCLAASDELHHSIHQPHSTSVQTMTKTTRRLYATCSGLAAKVPGAG